MPHRARAPLAGRHPLHVTVRLRPGLPSLRRHGTYRALEPALVAGSERFGFRLVEYSAQTNHLHMIVEAKDRRALSRGMQGLLVRAARALNRRWRRRGSVFGDRYHDRALRTPREVRCALAYVLNNARRHGVRLPPGTADPFSTAGAFAGWSRRAGRLLRRPDAYGKGGPRDHPIRLPNARTWLLSIGWRRHGPIDPDEVPGRRRSSR